MKERKNSTLILKILREMTYEAKLKKAFELSDFVKSLFIEGMRQSFPELTADQLHKKIIERLNKCHNRNY